MNRKKYGKIVVFVLLFALCMLLPERRETVATPIPDADISVNYEYETLTVKTADDSIIYFTDSYTDNLDKWYSCEVRNGVASFDISWVKKTATVRLYLCGDVNTKVVCKDVGWQDKLDVSFTGTLLTTDITEAEQWKTVYKNYPLFSEDTGYFIFTLEENGRNNSYFDLANVEWRKGDDGVWRNFDELDLKEMNIRGITLSFRIKAVNDTVGADGSRTSSVAKIPVVKLSGDPGVKLDMDRMEVDIKNGQEFSLDGEHWTLIPTYNKRATTDVCMVGETERGQAISEITTNTKVSGLLLHDLLGLNSNAKLDRASFQTYGGNYEHNGTSLSDATGIYIYVRTAGTMKKAASKMSKVFVPFTEAPAVAADAGALTIAYLESKTATGGITVTNTSDLKYEFAIVTPKEQAAIDWDDADIAEMKWTSIKEGRSMKVAVNKLPKGSYLLYRIAAEEGRMPSTYVRSMQINYDEVTYAGVAQEYKKVGEVLVAVTSTNLTMADVTCTWQRCADVKAENPVWENITTGATYTITNADAGKYLRVVIRKTGSAIKAEGSSIGPITDK
ncbi:MAG: hypothetical protein ACI4FZ_13445 [Lachnospiraceae bacterium]